MLLKEIAVQLMEHLCNHDWHGYSQVSRWGDGEGTCPVTIGGKTYYLEQGDRDCSSAIVSAFEAAGISCGGASYTGNMRSCMVGTGNFKWHPMSSGYIAQRGDVYLKEGAHTAMCTSAVPDMLAEFSISETGGIDGTEGDQTGRESYIHAYYDYPWDGILECVCKDTDGNASGGSGTVSNAGNTSGAGSGGQTIHFRYRVRTKEDGWLPEVVNLADYAGIPGHAITDIAIGVDRGSLWYQVHVKGGGWLPAVSGYNINDYNNGYAGNGQVIDAVRVYYNTPADYVAQYGYQKAQYRVSPMNGNYWPWQYDNETGGGQDGYAGVIGKAIDRFQLF